VSTWLFLNQLKKETLRTPPKKKRMSARATFFGALVARVASDASKAADAARALVSEAVEEVAVLLAKEHPGVVAYDRVVRHKDSIVARVVGGAGDATDNTTTATTKCRATKANGKACEARVRPGSEFCAAHRASGELQAARRRRIEAYDATLKETKRRRLEADVLSKACGTQPVFVPVSLDFDFAV
jgi:hypothetical protein